jgi:hypothetical protein
MRPLIALIVFAAVALGIYEYSLKQIPSSDTGTASTQAISLTGVRADLLQIAQAERANIATNTQCASLNDLISSGSLSMSRTERDGYSYSISCSSADFTVTATHPAPSTNSGVRYPTLAIDQSMQVREVQ